MSCRNMLSVMWTHLNNMIMNLLVLDMILTYYCCYTYQFMPHVQFYTASIGCSNCFTNKMLMNLQWIHGTRACRLETSKQYEKLFEEKLGSKINKQEAETVVKVALLCTNGSSSMRPTMSEVVNMLDGKHVYQKQMATQKRR
ncbi:hypothetical protein CTI12_AA308170 [Artemisia annua]|uniref:Uncharacterized protein n=1 Tax=Artemisia annua TaxID=35608 RepID=A0A2U1N4S7_ARTAN|nr:hypothetical protein CTI12_AA308170 [Artemisia annua]